MTQQLNNRKPHIINLDSIGETSIGYISIVESNKNIPFEVKRVFWTYFTPESIVRGRHAHYKTQQILVAVCGKIIVNTHSAQGDVHTFVLEKANQGLFVPPNYWHTMQYSHNAVQLVFASELYDPKDYIRDMEKFFEVWK